IAREKAGVARAGRPVVIGERDAEPALIQAITQAGAIAVRLGQDFDIWTQGQARHFAISEGDAVELPGHLPLAAPCQWENAATAIAALSMLPGIHPAALPGSDRLAATEHRDATAIPFNLAVAVDGLARARLPGRLERVATAPDVVVDVGHNPQAAAMLAQWLQGEGAGIATDAVFSALADKDVEGIVLP